MSRLFHSVRDWLSLQKRPQGAEAAATVRFSNDTEENVKGFIVKNNNGLTRLIDPRQSYLEKYKSTKYFVYIPAANVPQCKSNDTAEIKVLVSTSSSEKEYISCEVCISDDNNTIARVGAHHNFVPCESVAFNKNSFLKKYSKTVLTTGDKPPFDPASGETRFYGLNVDNIGLTLIQLRRSEQENNTLEVDDGVFGELSDGPLLHEDKINLVGYLQKNPERGQMKLHFFGMEESLDVWRASTFQSRATESDYSATSSNLASIKQKKRIPTYSNGGNEDVPLNDNGDDNANHCNKHNTDADDDDAVVNEYDVVASAVGTRVDGSAGSVAVEDGQKSSGKVFQPGELAHVTLGEDGRHVNHNVGEDGSEVPAVCYGGSSRAANSSVVTAHGDVVAANGDVVVANGDVVSANGDVMAANDDIVAVNGDVVAANGGVVAANGDVVAANGDGMTPNDDLVAIQPDAARDSENINVHETFPHFDNDHRVQKKEVAKPIERSLSDASGHFPIEEQVTFGDMYDKDCSVVQEMGLLLNKRQKVGKDVLSLADELGAPQIIKDKCRSNYNHSPSSDLIRLPKISMSTIETFCGHLKDIQRTDLAKLMKINLKAKKSFMPEQELKRVKTEKVEILMLNENHELFESITSKLDQPGQFNWRRLGQEYGIDSNELDNLEWGTNPAEHFLVEYAYMSVPKEDLKLSTLLKHMTDLGRGEEFKGLLLEIGENKELSKSMKEVFQPDSDNMEKLCKLLNKPSFKGWQHLAEKWKLERLRYNAFLPDKGASATQILLDWLMIQKPDFTVAQLYKSLQNIGRHDVCDDLLDKKLAKLYESLLC